MFKVNANSKSPSDVLHLDGAEIANWNFAPRSDWTVMGDTDHFVQFYETDGFLLSLIANREGARNVRELKGAGAQNSSCTR